jgi:hypothetical protein
MNNAPEVFKTNDWVFRLTPEAFVIEPRPGGKAVGAGVSIPRKDMGAALAGLGIVQIAVAQWEEPKPEELKPEGRNLKSRDTRAHR